MKIKNIVINVLIVGLCFSLILGMGAFLREIRDYHYMYDRKEEEFLYAIQDKNYAHLWEISNEMRISDKSVVKLKEYFAVADYYESALYYKAYMENHETKKAEEKKRSMKEAKGRMGKYHYVTEEILERLELK